MPRKKGDPYKLDLAGQKFGEWVVSSRKIGNRYLCFCSCGKEKMIQSSTLKRGTSKSCGCKGKDWCRKHGMEGTLTYSTWAGMKARCNNPENNLYKNYGGRGIKLCEPWNRFVNFLNDMGEKPPGKSLDRIDPNGDYSPKNCRWATPKMQSRNQRNTIYLEYNGERRPMAEWAEIMGIKRKVMEYRIREGWSVEEALNKKPRLKK